jgi:hypothetical protein
MSGLIRGVTMAALLLPGLAFAQDDKSPVPGTPDQDAEFHLRSIGRLLFPRGRGEGFSNDLCCLTRQRMMPLDDLPQPLWQNMRVYLRGRDIGVAE